MESEDLFPLYTVLSSRSYGIIAVQDYFEENSHDVRPELTYSQSDVYIAHERTFYAWLVLC